jgi:hypothetical protein
LIQIKAAYDILTKAVEIFRSLNQRCTKPLDVFDTTWLVAARGAAERDAAVWQVCWKYFNMSEAFASPNVEVFPYR